MFNKFNVLSLAIAAVLAGCASDNVAWHDTAGRDTTGANYNSGSDYNNGIRSNGAAYNAGLPDNPQATLNDKTRSLSSFSVKDNTFIRDVQAGDAYEISAGQKALVKSSDAQLKSFAQHMIDDHTKADKQITDLATRHGITNSAGMTVQQIDMLRRLDTLSGADFDREFMTQQEQAHKDTIAKFQDASRNADAADLRDWATATLPTLQGHLTMIQGRVSPTNIDRTTDINRSTDVRPSTDLNNNSTNLNNSGSTNINPGGPNNLAPGEKASNTGDVGTPGSSGMNK